MLPRRKTSLRSHHPIGHHHQYPNLHHLLYNKFFSHVIGQSPMSELYEYEAITSRHRQLLIHDLHFEEGTLQANSGK